MAHLASGKWDDIPPSSTVGFFRLFTFKDEDDEEEEEPDLTTSTVGAAGAAGVGSAKYAVTMSAGIGILRSFKVSYVSQNIFCVATTEIGLYFIFALRRDLPAS